MLTKTNYFLLHLIILSSLIPFQLLNRDFNILLLCVFATHKIRNYIRNESCPFQHDQ